MKPPLMSHEPARKPGFENSIEAKTLVSLPAGKEVRWRCHRRACPGMTNQANARMLRCSPQFSAAPALLHLDAGDLDHLGPLFGGVADDGREFRRRAAEHGAAQLHDPLPDPRVGEAGV